MTTSSTSSRRPLPVEPGQAREPVVGMRAAATLVAERVGERTRCTTLRSEPPLALRVTPGAADETSVYLVGSAAGPVGGDRLSLTIAIGAGAGLRVGSVAATTVLPGPGRAGTGPVAASHVDVTVSVRDGGGLRWLPEPTILVTGCDHQSSTRITLDATADLVWREVVVLGRHGEPSGSLLQRFRVDVGGHPLLRHDLAIGPRWPASQGPAGVGRDCRAVGTVLLTGTPVEDVSSALPAPGPPDLRAAVLPLAAPPGAPPAVLLSALATQGAMLVAFLDHVLGSVLGAVRSI